MRLIQAPLSLSDLLALGRSNAIANTQPVQGLPAAAVTLNLASGWQTDPLDCRGLTSLSLELAILAAASPAVLYVPSATTGLGLLFAANLPGSAGDAIQVTISTPNATAGFIHTVVTTVNSIVINPAVGDTNSSIAALVNSDVHASPLVTAYVFGVQGYGDMTTYPQGDGTRAAQIDLVVAATIANLAGGADTSGPSKYAQSGTVTLYGSNQWNTLGIDTNAILASGEINASSATLTLQIKDPPRFVVAQFVPNAGSLGSILGDWHGRASA